MDSTSPRYPADPPRMARTAIPAAALALAMAAPVPARADVFEIGQAGELRNITASPVAGEASDAAALAVSEAAPLPDHALSSSDAVLAPGLFPAELRRAAHLAGVSEALLEALVWQESRWRPAARSSAGAIGLGQLMPGTARQLGVDPRDPAANLIGAALYLRQMLDLFDNNLELALAAYNAGPRRVSAARGVPPIRETRDYVTAIIGRLSAQAVSG